MKNIHYTNHPLIVEGDKLFRTGNYEEALIKFNEYLNEFPLFKKFVLGRISITQLKLQCFEEAKNNIIEAIELSKEGEKEYSIILAECFHGLKLYKQAFNYCNNYIERYGKSEDIQAMLNRILPTNEYALLLKINDLDFNETVCANALLSISRKYYLNEDFEEAEYYATMRINYSDINVIEGYYLLGTIYSETHEYYKCANLIQKLKRSEVSGREKGLAYSFLLEIYKNSLCYPISELSQQESKLEGLIEMYSKFKEEMKMDKVKEIFNNYRPSLNLSEYFDFEVKSQLISA